MMAQEADFLRPLVRTVIQEFLEAEMVEAYGLRLPQPHLPAFVNKPHPGSVLKVQQKERSW
jgi:hypothetical protein